MDIYSVTDDRFKKYGKVIEDVHFSELLKEMELTDIPEDVYYTPSYKPLEKTGAYSVIKDSLYGGMPIQIGYCNGNNYSLNALEYHRSSEINIAATDFILLLGLESDINMDFTYDTSKVEAFYVQKGMVIEVYATTLHYAPCNADDDGFRCVVALPQDTNTELSQERSVTGTKEDRLLFAKNKWLIAHKESGLDKQGAYIGLVGKNITLK